MHVGSRPARHPRRRFLAATLAAASVPRWAAGMRSARGLGPAAEAPRTVTRRGFFDLQVNGFAGVDFNDPSTTAEQVAEAIAALRTTGVTRFLPTLITAPLDEFRRCARTLAASRAPAIAGVHMEGLHFAGGRRARRAPA